MKTLQSSFYFIVLSILSTFACSMQLIAQCPSGTIGVSGSGCGCIAGCNLTSIGGPNCGSGVSGNCSAGQVPYSTTIDVPNGCSYTVTAVISDRAGCTSSQGADSGDKMKVDIAGGTKPFLTGSGNGTLIDSYTLTGPGSIVISGTVNRADEIITYTTTATGPACVDCMSVLPVELTEFEVFRENNTVVCEWSTETELNNDFFTIERSTDGIQYEVLSYVKGAGTSKSPLIYKIYDSDPFVEITSYYKLSQTDFNGVSRVNGIRSVKATKIEQIEIFPNPSKGQITILGDIDIFKTVQILDISGRIIELGNDEITNNTITLTSLSEGIYTVLFFDNENTQSRKIIITK